MSVGALPTSSEMAANSAQFWRLLDSTVFMVRRFVLGEGIEKRSADLAKEVEAQTKAFEEAAAKKSAEAAAAPAAEAAAAPALEKVRHSIRLWCLTHLPSLIRI